MAASQDSEMELAKLRVSVARRELEQAELKKDLLTFSQDEGKFDPRSIPLKSWNDHVSHLLILVAFLCIII